MPNARIIVGTYFLLQAIAIGAWWSLLLWVEGATQWFQPSSFSPEALFRLQLADLAGLGAGSLLVSFATFGQRAWASVAAWCVAGLSLYPTLYCLQASCTTGEAWLATSLMVSMTGLTFAHATMFGTHRSPSLFRVNEKSIPLALSWTLVQTVFFWAIFLWILPLGIVDLTYKLGWSDQLSFAHRGQRLIGWILFIFASGLGLWSGTTMAWVGRGTPLPTSAAPRLVVLGPYRFLRNPMAAAGIAQGIAVGWLMGSLPVIGYALTGAVFWHFLVRPGEEEDLSLRFGDSFRDYCDRVGLWLPKLFR